MVSMHTNRLEKYKIAALIVAAGVGSRCNAKIPKQYIKLAGKSVLFYTIRKFLANQYISYIRVVVNESQKDFYKEVTSSTIDTKLLSPVCGGKAGRVQLNLDWRVCKRSIQILLLYMTLVGLLYQIF